MVTRKKREEGFSEGETCRVSVLVADFGREWMGSVDRFFRALSIGESPSSETIAAAAVEVVGQSHN